MLRGAAVYIALINILTFFVYGLDKSAAVKQKQRIPNRVLLGLAAIGGSAGALAGMYTFRHKTQKKYYTITVPLMLTMQIAAAAYNPSASAAIQSATAKSDSATAESANQNATRQAATAEPGEPSPAAATTTTTTCTDGNCTIGDTPTK